MAWFHARLSLWGQLYSIDVRNPHRVSRGVASVAVDGVAVTDPWINLIDDGSQHLVTIVLGPAPPTG